MDDILRKAHTGERGNPGEFGTHDRPDAEVTLSTGALPGDVTLAPGEDDYLYAGPLGFDDLPPIGISRFEDGDAYLVSPTVPVPLLDWAPTNLTDEEKAAWVEDRRPAIETFLRNRYGAHLTGLDTWDDDVERIRRAGAEVSIVAEQNPDGTISHQAIADAVNRSSAVTMTNEFDDGTFGTLNASRLLREYLDTRAIAASADEMTPAAIDREVRARNGKRELRAETARAIARRLAYEAYDGIVDVPQPVPHLDDLAYSGHADKEELMADLRAIYAVEGRMNSRVRIDMLMTWILHGTPDRETATGA
ncbi:hypothetical protein [Curtobacterium sp. MCBD17_040]|uniref:hypothetical protein n=1 Tax=Curtobacterium sp. MCBD17_040 TaxID=2175674 RepID=UPI000DA896E2|nr:hypothetical protein [Curtobacterium sp. MCBD17_040]WIB65354.1 hypothetical protein DEI94_18275 [Curtobacterium sp. MCBD17_040]